MNPVKAVSYVFSAFLPLARACRQACAYCSFPRQGEGLPPFADIGAELKEIAESTATQVVFLTGDTPSDDPSIQVALHQLGLASFWEYLDGALTMARTLKLFPVLAGGYLSRFDAERLSGSGIALRIDLVPAPLHGAGQVHENAPGRTPQAGRMAIECAHQAELPYHLHLLVGIGEDQATREHWIRETGKFCASDPFLQDVTLVPFQPLSDTPCRGRPPLVFDAIRQACSVLQEAFPVHFRGVPPHLFSRFPELVAHGMNDLGALPLLTNDATTPGFPLPSLELLRKRLQEEDVHLFERLPITTPAGMRHPARREILDHQQILLGKRQSGTVRLIDNGRCFVCGLGNPAGLHVTFEQRDENTWLTNWTPGTRFQGYAGIVHGGILSTVLDEVMAQCLWRAGLRVLTADMKIRFLKPVPIGLPLQIIGTREGQRGNLHFTRGRVLGLDGTKLAEAEGRYIEIQDSYSS